MGCILYHHFIINLILWNYCSVTVMFAIQLPRASPGWSMNKHTAMLQNMLEIGSPREIRGKSFQLCPNEEVFHSSRFIVGNGVLVYIWHRKGHLFCFKAVKFTLRICYRNFVIEGEYVLSCLHFGCQQNICICYESYDCKG